jgi:hypothetical protein
MPGYVTCGGDVTASQAEILTFAESQNLMREPPSILQRPSIRDNNSEGVELESLAPTMSRIFTSQSLTEYSNFATSFSQSAIDTTAQYPQPVPPRVVPDPLPSDDQVFRQPLPRVPSARVMRIASRVSMSAEDVQLPVEQEIIVQAQVTGEIVTELKFQKLMAENTTSDTLDSHMSRLRGDLTGTHHELDGFVHTDPHDAFSMQETHGRSRVATWLQYVSISHIYRILSNLGINMHYYHHKFSNFFVFLWVFRCSPHSEMQGTVEFLSPADIDSPMSPPPTPKNQVNERIIPEFELSSDRPETLLERIRTFATSRPQQSTLRFQRRSLATSRTNSTVSQNQQTEDASVGVNVTDNQEENIEGNTQDSG